jgi:hypothetical protein
VTVEGVWIEYWIYWYNSELQEITALSLISTLYKSLTHPNLSQSSLVVSWQRIVTTAHSRTLATNSFLRNQTFSSQLTGQVKVKATLRLTVGQSVSLRAEPHLGLMTRYYLLFGNFCFVLGGGAPSLTRGWVCLLSESGSRSKSNVSMYSYIHLTCFTFWHIYTIYTRPLSVRAQYSRLCHISGSFHCNGSLVTWTDRIEGTVSNNNPIVVEACLPIRCLQTGCITP